MSGDAGAPDTVKQTARSTPRVATGAVRAVVDRISTALAAAGWLDSAAPAAAVAEAAAEQEEQYDHDDEDGEHEPRTGLSGWLPGTYPDRAPGRHVRPWGGRQIPSAILGRWPVAFRRA
jgi:hypothetical protein